MSETAKSELSSADRYLIASIAFLGWLFAGVQLGVVSIVMREAAKDLLLSAPEGTVGRWFGFLTAGFMLGAAAGGYLLGWMGDRWGRKRAIIASVICYSVFSGLTYFVFSPESLLLMRFLVGVGVGGMWPNGISLVSEAWPKLSRPGLAGLIGAAANIGTMLFSILTCFVHVTTENWRWVMVLGTLPLLLALVTCFLIPESPQWLAAKTKRMETSDARKESSTLLDIFLPPMLRITLVGIVLGTIPLFGGWGSSNWATAWASEVGETQQTNDPTLKAQTMLARSAPGSVSSLLGGLVSNWLGRRFSYFVFALGCLITSQYLFRFSHPSQASFLWWTAALGVFNGFFFGWLPLCLPELFPTRMRATGAGVSFNFGRIATALGILVVASLLKETFGGDYAKIGQVTSWIYFIGAVVIWFSPRFESQPIQQEALGTNAKSV